MSTPLCVDKRRNLRCSPLVCPMAIPFGPWADAKRHNGKYPRAQFWKAPDPETPENAEFCPVDINTFALSPTPYESNRSLNHRLIYRVKNSRYTPSPNKLNAIPWIPSRRTPIPNRVFERAISASLSESCIIPETYVYAPRPMNAAPPV
jgi:hypothetical protein